MSQSSCRNQSGRPRSLLSGDVLKIRKLRTPDKDGDESGEAHQYLEIGERQGGRRRGPDVRARRGIMKYEPLASIQRQISLPPNTAEASATRLKSSMHGRCSEAWPRSNAAHDPNYWIHAGKGQKWGRTWMTMTC